MRSFTFEGAQTFKNLRKDVRAELRIFEGVERLKNLRKASAELKIFEGAERFKNLYGRPVQS